MSVFSARHLAWFVLLIALFGCAPRATPTPALTREQAIPKDAIKMSPAMDVAPPILHSSEWEKPVPLPGPINSAGGEDGPFILPDGNTFFFFFTPDVSVPPEKQLFDGVTGCWWSKRVGETWGKPERIVLSDDVALDGCEFVQGSTMYFCSARKGNFRDIDIWTAELRDGKWTNWKNAGKELNVEHEVGELHFSADWRELYFHSPRAGGKGKFDLWLMRSVNGIWQTPENIAALNTTEDEGWPYLSPDGNELWFTRIYRGAPAIFRSKKSGGKWSVPEMILSQFAGEPTLDARGNLYFTHHFFKDGKMIEADIYVAYRKKG